MDLAKCWVLIPDLVIPDKNLSVFEGAIAPWRSEKMSEEFLKPLLKNGIRFDFPIHRPYKDLTPAEQELLWTGNKYFDGMNAFFTYVESQTFKVQYRVMLSRYRGKTTCPECRGSRLRKDAGYVKVAGKSITDLVLMPITQVTAFFRDPGTTRPSAAGCQPDTDRNPESTGLHGAGWPRLPDAQPPDQHPVGRGVPAH